MVCSFEYNIKKMEEDVHTPLAVFTMAEARTLLSETTGMGKDHPEFHFKFWQRFYLLYEGHVAERDDFEPEPRVQRRSHLASSGRIDV